MEKTVNNELNNLNLWLNVNRLALNITKTRFVLLSTVNEALKNVCYYANKQRNFLSKGIPKVSWILN